MIHLTQEYLLEPGLMNRQIIVRGSILDLTFSFQHRVVEAMTVHYTIEDLTVITGAVQNTQNTLVYTHGFFVFLVVVLKLIMLVLGKSAFPLGV